MHWRRTKEIRVATGRLYSDSLSSINLHGVSVNPVLRVQIKPHNSDSCCLFTKCPKGYVNQDYGWLWPIAVPLECHTYEVWSPEIFPRAISRKWFDNRLKECFQRSEVHINWHTNSPNMGPEGDCLSYCHRHGSDTYISISKCIWSCTRPSSWYVKIIVCDTVKVTAESTHCILVRSRCEDIYILAAVKIHLHICAGFKQTITVVIRN